MHLLPTNSPTNQQRYMHVDDTFQNPAIYFTTLGITFGHSKVLASGSPIYAD